MEFFSKVGYIFAHYWQQLLQGVGVTLAVSLTGTAAGLIIGLGVGTLRAAPLPERRTARFFRRILDFILNAYVEVFRGTPMLVQAMVIYWGFALAAGGKTMDTMFAAILIVSVNTGAYITEIVRGGILSVDRGQTEGAYALGMKHSLTMAKVILPQAFVNILPAVSNEFVINVKDTSVLFVLVGFVDLYAVGKIIVDDTYSNFEAYFVICVIYFLLTFGITRLLRLAEKKLGGKADYSLYNSDIVGTKEG